MAKNGTTHLVEDDLDTTSADAMLGRIVEPYSADVVIEGVTNLLCHRYDCSEVESKEKAAKGSAQKKTDNLESYVYRVPGTNECGVPGVNVKACLVEASRWFQDPRSKRKSAMDLMRASIYVTPEIMSFGKKTWDFIDRRPVVIQQSRVSRLRPGFAKGWRLAFKVNVIQPEMITTTMLEEVVKKAGALVGLCDFRPDFGRFTIRKFEIQNRIDAE